MERDRFAENKPLFIISLCCLLICMALLTFAFYIMPALIWGWHYNLPEFVYNWREWVHVHFELTDDASSGLIFVILLVLAGLAGLISNYASNRIENQIYYSHTSRANETGVHYTKIKEDLLDTLNFTVKVLFFVLMALAGLFLLQWLISTSPPVT